MSSTVHTLILSEAKPVNAPTPAEIPVILRHLSSDPESYFILEYEGGYAQGYESPENDTCTYHLEYADHDEETGEIHNWRIPAPVSLEVCAEFLTLVLEGNPAWRSHFEWEVLDLSLPPDTEVNLGQFSPGDAQKLLMAMEAAEVPVRMEQVAGTTFSLIVPAEHLEAANAVVAKAFNLQV